jgi:uncharacterized repeat protein (TIGR03803 family)
MTTRLCFGRGGRNHAIESEGEKIMLHPGKDRLGVLVMILLAATAGRSALAHDTDFSLLYAFEAPAPVTFTSALGSQPDTRPVLGPWHSVYGMTSDGGANGNGVIYRYDLDSGRYTLLHTFRALDANGYNDDGATPGVALTRGPDDVFYGVASYGGKNGNGTLFKITASGEFTVLHTFGALDANAHNQDGANPLRTVIIGDDGSLYGSTRLGGEHTCGTVPFLNSCGVAWRLEQSGKFSVIHQFLPSEGHAASLTQARDGFLYGCAVWPATSLPSGAPLPSGLLYRMAGSGDYFEVLYTFSQTDASGDNKDGADCYEPLLEASPGEFYGSATNGGTGGNGVVFRYSLAKPHAVEIVHAFSVVNGAGENPDGAYPYARLTLGRDGTMDSTASYGGSYGNGVVYRIACDGTFEVLHTFSAVNALSGANADGATPDFGVVLDRDDSLIGMTDYGGNGSSAGLGNSGGTLYRLALHP